MAAPLWETADRGRSDGRRRSDVALTQPRPSPESDRRRSLKVAVIHGVGFFYSGGGEKLVIQQVLGLRERGHRVDCFAPIVDPARSFPGWLDRVGVRRLAPHLPNWLRFPDVLANGAYMARVLSRTYARAFSSCPAGAEAVIESASRFTGAVRVRGLVIPKPFVLLSNRHYPQKRFEVAIEALRHPALAARRIPLVITGQETAYTLRLREPG